MYQIGLSVCVRCLSFDVSRRRREMYIDHERTCVCLCVCLSLAAFPHYGTDPDLSWVNGRGWPPVVHYLADLQSVHGFRCYDNTAPNAKCQRVLVLALSPVKLLSTTSPNADQSSKFVHR